MAHRPEVDFRPLSHDDLALLSSWLRDPVVARWWQRPDPDHAAAEYARAIDGEDTTEVFTVLVDGRPAGLIQRYRMADEPEWTKTLSATTAAPVLPRAAGIDYLLGEPDVRGRGIGTAMIERFTDATFSEWHDVDAIVVSVQQGNRASWRVLERAGYRKVWSGVLDSDDPSDAGPAFVLVAERGQPWS